ncbi:MAG: PIN domain-containing protein [Catalinimonas sp.]
MPMVGGSSFVDTNVWVYAYSADDLTKQRRAQAVCNAPNAMISTQVIHELINTFRRKFHLDWTDLDRLYVEVSRNFPVHVNDTTTVRAALKLAERWGFSWFDALIVAAALEANADTLYSEDLQHGQVINEALTIRNPFV